jgi:hypothetical protein
MRNNRKKLYKKVALYNNLFPKIIPSSIGKLEIFAKEKSSKKRRKFMKISEQIF